MYSFLPQLWNNGFSKEIIHFKYCRLNEFSHLSNIAVSQDPFFQYSAKASLRAQHSTIPIGAKPLTCNSLWGVHAQLLVFKAPNSTQVPCLSSDNF